MKKSKETMTQSTTMRAMPTTPTTPTTPTIETKEEPVKEETPVETPEVEPETALMVLKRELPELAERLEHLVTSMDPNKPGFEEMGGARWTPAIVRIHQGLSRNVPMNSKLGGLYTDTGDMLTMPWEFVPVYMHYSNTKFAMSADGSGGGDSDKNRLCMSMDGETSTRGQLCAECPDRPFRDNHVSDCKRAIEVYVFDKNFENLYKIQFVKTSYRAGSKLFRQAGATPTPWERVFALGVEQETNQHTNPPSKYYIFSVTPTGNKTDAKYLRLARFIYEKITEARKTMKASAAKRSPTPRTRSRSCPTTSEPRRRRPLMVAVRRAR